MSDAIKILFVDCFRCQTIQVKFKPYLEEQGLKVIGIVFQADEAARFTKQLHPDVVLINVCLVCLPKIDGLKALESVHNKIKTARIILLVPKEKEEYLYACLAGGANGYCLEDVEQAQLYLAIKAVYVGGFWLDPAIAALIMPALIADKVSRISQQLSETRIFAPLSTREVEILEYIVKGLSNPEIAQALKISKETVKSHVKSLMGKLAVSDRTQAAVKAIKQKLI